MTGVHECMTYTDEDFAVFDSMPDTATKAAIREAIEQARRNRQERERLIAIADVWGTEFKLPGFWPDNWGLGRSGEMTHPDIVQASLRWLIDTAYPEVKP